MNISDRELEERIKHILREDTRVDPNEVNLRVENGVVHLEGTVDSAAERKAVRDDVETVSGVLQVADHLGLKNYIERTDEELVEAVKQDLMRDPYVDIRGIKISASNGEVRLSGTVNTFAEKSAAENRVWWTPGVLDVMSHLVTEESELDEGEPVW